MRRLVWLVMEGILKGSWGVGGLALLRRGLILNPSNRGKVQSTLHLPLLQQDDEEADLDGGLYARTRKLTAATFSILRFRREMCAAFGCFALWL